MKLPMPFQTWTTYRGHSGVDFPYARNTPIRASGEGTVTAINYSSTGGWRVWVDYGEGRVIKYAHMDSRDKIIVSVGEHVSYGQTIAYVGSLGVGSTGPHLHIENANRAGFDYVWEIVDSSTWVTNETKGNTLVYIIWVNGGAYFVGPGGRKGIASPRDLDLLKRVLRCTPDKQDTFNAAELDIITSYFNGLG